MLKVHNRNIHLSYNMIKYIIYNCIIHQIIFLRVKNLYLPKKKSFLL